MGLDSISFLPLPFFLFNYIDVLQYVPCVSNRLSGIKANYSFMIDNQAQ